jgi:hypothetical protein
VHQDTDLYDLKIGAGNRSAGTGVAGGGDSCGGDVTVGGDAEVDGFGAACGGQVGLGELASGGGEADLESFGFAGPAFAFGFGDAVQEVVADLLEAVALGGVDSQERASDGVLTGLTRPEPSTSGHLELMVVTFGSHDRDRLGPGSRLAGGSRRRGRLSRPGICGSRTT